MLLGPARAPFHVGRRNIVATNPPEPAPGTKSRRWTLLVLLVLDATLLNAAVFGAFLLRFDGHIAGMYFDHYVQLALPFTVGALVIFATRGLYRVLWQYASLRELLMIGEAALLAGAWFWVLRLIAPGQGFPRTVIAGTTLLSFLFVGALRFAFRIQPFDASGLRAPSRHSHGRKTLVYGAGRAGAVFVRDMARTSRAPVDVIGFVDDDPAKQGKEIDHIGVLGSGRRLSELIRKHNVDDLVIAMPSLGPERLATVLARCTGLGVRLRIMPPVTMTTVLDHRRRIPLRDVDIEDLLARKPVTVDLAEVQSHIIGKCVLITGAGGSIGGELVRQVAALAPSTLILLGHGENSIFNILDDLRAVDYKVTVIPLIADVRDEQRIEATFSHYRPHIVFHAAAHKHVTLMEHNPIEAVSNNVFGTLNMALAAQRHQANTFVLISTDKAVNPTNYMGASKRLSEMIVQSLAQCNNGTRFAAVRFGNVLGSRGSVVPVFRRQIAAGGPVTVTHPSATRYFMTVPEAVELVLQAAVYAEGGAVFTLDMGAPVPIVDLATNLIRLSGYEPNHDIRIVFTGLRPGEKLHEELWADTEVLLETRHPRIHRVVPSVPPWATVERQLQVLRRLVQEDDLPGLRLALGDMGVCPALAATEEIAAADEASQPRSDSHHIS